MMLRCGGEGGRCGLPRIVADGVIVRLSADSSAIRIVAVAA